LKEPKSAPVPVKTVSMSKYSHANSLAFRIGGTRRLHCVDGHA
jgi:hypothetical protein